MRIFCSIALGALSLLVSHSALAAQITLTWDPVNDSSLLGYKIYYGTASSNYTTSIDAKNSISYTVTGLNDGATYYFAVASYSSTTQSAFSGEVSFTTPRPQVCTFSLSSGSPLFNASPNSGSINVTAPAGCAWSSSSPPMWITVTSGATGTGNGVLNFSVAANTTASSRTAALTIAGQLFTLTQSGLQELTTASARSGGRISSAGTVQVKPSSTQTLRSDPQEHTIMASATSGGRISPAGTFQVKGGAILTFVILRRPGYKIAEVKVDGVSVGAVTSYTLVNVTMPHTIEAAFDR